MLDFLEKQKNELDGYQKLLDVPDIELWLKWGSTLENTCPLMKAKYVFHEEIDPVEFLDTLQLRRKDWDKNVILLEELNHLSSEVSLIHYGIKAPVFFMKAKDFVEKML